jgi:hypothetical protein
MFDHAVFLHYPFWAILDPETVGITIDEKEEKEKLLRFIEHRWSDSDIPFGLPRITPA